MKIYGRAPASEFLGDRVVYRNLVPMNPTLPGLERLRETLGLESDFTPRKTTPAYARVIVHILKAAQELETPGVLIQRVVFIGDTCMNDSTAFSNICRAGNWPGWAFIGSEDHEPLRYEVQPLDVGAVAYANRWTALGTFEDSLLSQDFPIDEGTAVLLDLDKTILGARGRNDKVIDQARMEAALITVRDLLGDLYDPDAFQAAYQELNQVEYHPFTTDNQDYLVYICLMLAAGLFDLAGLAVEVRSGQIADFIQFIEAAETQSAKMNPRLRGVHNQVVDRLAAGDPTPFKVFRENEYQATVARLGQAVPDSPVSEVLRQEIVLTQEVRTLALKWRSQGALLFGLSDKPDEASVPSSSLASQGYLPIHHIATSVVGA